MSEEKSTLTLNQSRNTTSKPPASSGRKVVVACKLPHGLWLRRFEKITFQGPVLGGGMRDQVEYREVGERQRVYGNAMPVMRDPDKDYPQLSSGYALTYGIDGDLWDAWLEANKDTAMVLNGLIFADEHADRAVSMAREGRDIRTGLEPIDRKGDPRMPKAGANVSGITADIAG